jgi:drug/metabolite transporter (DMT)-like permease
MGQRDWIVLIASSILGIALGHAFLYSSVKRLGAAVTSGAQTTTPFFTAFLAALMLEETMSAMSWTGGITMVAGALTLIVAQSQLPQTPATKTKNHA